MSKESDYQCSRCHKSAKGLVNDMCPTCFHETGGLEWKQPCPQCASNAKIIIQLEHRLKLYEEKEARWQSQEIIEAARELAELVQKWDKKQFGNVGDMRVSDYRRMTALAARLKEEK